MLTIDPLIRCCVEHRELPAILDEHAETITITNEDRKKWLDTFYEEDFKYVDIDVKTHYIIKRRKED
ncbi:hypothetical protein [Pseudoalteromonas sp. NGC95]|uniref:hypothetical protein n=1 Tax=Pseudoalteromonas sp. NGC95 TaxID=2792051 RepID=UPI0018CD57DD|nr:hypothetical protein [Pseudoalteromonas sp. NGC95]MBH0017907.1 hypothetical protein [Pseudoalteromonas sp. NGC95]